MTGRHGNGREWGAGGKNQDNTVFCGLFFLVAVKQGSPSKGEFRQLLRKRGAHRNTTFSYCDPNSET